MSMIRFFEKTKKRKEKEVVPVHLDINGMQIVSIYAQVDFD